MLDLNYLQSSVMTYFICLVLNLFAFGNHFLELVNFLADHIQFFVHRVQSSMRQVPHKTNHKFTKFIAPEREAGLPGKLLRST